MKTPITRRIFFWTLCVSYFITTATVLFFVFGYRHDMENKIFVYTGSLTLKSNPKSINIKLNNKEPKSRLVNIINDSYFITGLRPGSYEVSVDLDGFKSWSKEINIHSGLSTELWNILLLRDNYEKTDFDIENIDDFFPAPKENMFAMTRQMGKTFITYVFDTKDNRAVNSFVFPKTTFTNNVFENIEWSPDSDQLIIPVIVQTEEENKDYIIASTETNEYVMLSEHIRMKDIKIVRWDPEEKNVILFLADNNLYRVDLEAVNQNLNDSMIVQDVRSYDFADDGLYVLDSKGDLYYGGDKKKASNLEQITHFDINENTNNYRLIAYDNHRVIAINDDSGDLYLYNKGEKNIYTKQIGSNIVGAHFSDDGKKLLFYSPFEIFVYTTRDVESQPVRYEDQIQSITRFSQKIDNVHFSKKYEHIIYTVGKDIKITELDYRGSRVTDTIVSLEDEQTTVINKHKMNKLFFINTTDKSKRQLQSIEFPEKETLF